MPTYGDEILQVLPLKKDKTLLGYHKRMESLFSDYCLVCDELLKTNSKHHAILSGFTNELYKNVGFPNRFSEMGLYLGNYRKTPFGVHVDSCGVFSFPVMGTKKFRLWTDSFVKKNPQLNRAFKYDKYKKSSQLIQANPGDMAYWPSSAWHIAESEGSFSATWSLGVWVDKPHSESFMQSLDPLIKSKLGSDGLSTVTSFEILHDSDGQVRKLPRAHENSIKLIQSMSNAEIKEALLKSWMLHISKQGFKNSPVTNPNKVTMTKVKLRHLNSPILWQHGLIDEKKIYFCFNGSIAETSQNSQLLRLIKDLNAGKSCTLKDYLISKHKSADMIILNTLRLAGAFD